MNKMINSILFFIVVFAFGLSACYDDKGNYDYRDLNSPVIDTAGMGLAEELVAYQFQNFRFGDNLVKYTGDAANLAYEWKICSQNPPSPATGEKYDSAKVLSVLPVLDTVIYEVPGKYYLMFTVSDKSNGEVKEFLRLNLSVESELTKGLCVMDEKNGKYDLNLIKTSRLVSGITESEEPVIYNIFSGVNTGVEITNATFLARAYNAAQGANLFYLFTEKGGYLLDPNTYGVVSNDYTTRFSFPLMIKGRAESHVFSGRPMEFMVIDGKLYGCDYRTFGTTVFNFGDQYPAAYGDYKLAPFIHCLTKPNAVAVFDQQNHRFTTLGEVESTLDVVAETSSGVFNLQNIDKDMVYMEGGLNAYTNAIFKDHGAESYYLYIADFTKRDKEDGNLLPIGTPVAKYSMAGCNGITSETLFVFGTKGEVCYYSSGSDLYLYQYSLSANVSHSIHTFNGEQITAMKLFTKDGHEKDGRILMVATYKEAGESNEGKVYLLDIDVVNGTVLSGLDTPYKGFGKIVDFIYKE